MGQSVGSVDSSFFLGRYRGRSVQNADTGIRRMERGVGIASSNSLGGSNNLKSSPSLDRFTPPPTLGSGYDGMLTKPRHLQALDWEIGLYKETYQYLFPIEPTGSGCRCIRRWNYADLAFAVSIPGLGIAAIPHQIRCSGQTV
jgi:hypothetical protein